MSSTELQKPSSERFVLVKFFPSLRLTDIVTLKSVSPPPWIYEATLDFPYEVDSVQVDGVNYSSSSTQNPASSKYYYDQASKKFEINMALPLTDQEINFFFILRFTDSETMTISDSGERNPEFGAKTWEPRLLNVPEINQSVQNFLVGLPTVSATTIALTNADDYLNQFITADHSWYNKNVEFEFYVNESKFFSFNAKTRRVAPRRDIVSVSMYDDIYTMQDACLMRDSTNDAYYNRSNFTNMDQTAEGRAIPFAFGRSAMRFVRAQVGSETFRFDTTKTNQAVCLNITTSREWGLCRGPGGGLRIPDYDDANNNTITVSGSEDYGDSTRSKFEFTCEHNDDALDLLDTVELIKSATTYYGVVTSIVNGTGTDSIFRGIMKLGAPTGTYDGAATSPATTQGIMVQQGENYYYLMNDTDYTLSAVTTDGGNSFYKATFTSGFESNHPGMTTINYETDKVYYRMTFPAWTHADVMERILEKAQITVSSSDFSSIATPTTSNIIMQIPEAGSSNFGKISDYVGRIAQSVFGFLYQKHPVLETGYKLFEAPTATNIVFENEVIALTYVVDGKEMALDTRISNEDNFYYYTRAASGSSKHGDPADRRYLNYNLDSNISRYIHGLNNSKTQETACQSTEHAITEKGAFIENEQLIVTFSTAGKFANLNIGDSISVQDARLPGDKTTVDGIEVKPLRILGIKVSSARVTFTCIDFKGL